MGRFPSGQRGQTVNLLQLLRWFESTPAHFFFINIAGWSSLAARRAHNPKVIGSNPIPATQKGLSKSFFYFSKIDLTLNHNVITM